MAHLLNNLVAQPIERIATLLEGLLEGDNKARVLGQSLLTALGPGSVRILIKLALLNDCLGIVEHAISDQDQLTDKEMKLVYPFLKTVARYFAQVRPDYRPFAELPRDRAAAFLAFHRQDTKPFGRGCDKTRWLGLTISHKVAGSSVGLEALEAYKTMTAGLIAELLALEELSALQREQLAFIQQLVAGKEPPPCYVTAAVSPFTLLQDSLEITYHPGDPGPSRIIMGRAERGPEGFLELPRPQFEHLKGRILQEQKKFLEGAGHYSLPHLVAHPWFQGEALEEILEEVLKDPPKRSQLAEILQSNPATAEEHASRARALLHLGLRQPGIRGLEEAIRLAPAQADPGCTDWHQLRAETYHSLGDDGPRNALACFQLGRQHGQAGIFSLAMACYREAMEADPLLHATWKNAQAAGIAPAHDPVARATIEDHGNQNREDANGQIAPLIEQGLLAQALKAAEAGLKKAQSRVPADHPHLATPLTELGWVFTELGRHQEAETVLQRSVAIRERTLGADHPQVAQCQNLLGRVLIGLGRLQEAEIHLQQALHVRHKMLGPEHPAVAETLAFLGLVRALQGKHAEGESLLRQALEVRKRVLGPEHPEVAAVLEFQGVALLAQGKAAEAENLHTQALTIRERALGPGHPQVAQSLDRLGQLFQDRAKHLEALAVHKLALEIREKTMGPDNPLLADTMDRLGSVCLVLNRKGQALSWFERAKQLKAKTTRGDHSVAGPGAPARMERRIAEGSDGKTPHGPGKKGALRLELHDGTVIVNPSDQEIADALNSQLAEPDRYAILERYDGTYIQTCAGEGAQGGVLEHQEGSLDRHFRARNRRLIVGQIIRAFQEFAREDPTWKSSLEWEKLDLSRSY